MKYVLVVATGILIGERDNDNLRIIKSLMFIQKETLIASNLEEYIKSNGEKILDLFEKKEYLHFLIPKEGLISQ